MSTSTRMSNNKSPAPAMHPQQASRSQTPCQARDKKGAFSVPAPIERRRNREVAQAGRLQAVKHGGVKSSTKRRNHMI